MNISEFAFRQRALILFSLLLAMSAGVMAYFTLPAREDPEVTIREAIVTTTYANVPAEEVERLVTRPLEEAIVTLPELDEVRSTSIDGMSIIHAKVEDKYSELEQIWDELAEAVAQASAQLPPEAGTPLVNDDFGDVAVMTLALHSKAMPFDSLYDLAQEIRNTLIFVDGSRRIELHGVPEEVFYIDFDESTLNAFGLDKREIVEAVAANNNYAAIGSIDTRNHSLLLTSRAGLDSVQKIIDLPISINTASDGQVARFVRLGDLAKVTKTERQPYQRAAFFNGERAIVLSIAMQPEESVINYTKRLESVLDDTINRLPQGVYLEEISKQSIEVEKAVYGVSWNVVQTLCIVLAVVMLFLGIRTGLIVGAIVPGVMLVTLAVMGIYDMQLERMSLATLVIALGLLVDNGIVVAEYFKRQLEKHGRKQQALYEVGKELALPLLSSTATTVVVFIPLMMAEHGSGEYTRNISLVILISLSVSWLLAMTVTPTLCYLFMSDKPEKKTRISTAFDQLEVYYTRLLSLALNHRKTIMVFAVAMFFMGVKLVSSAPAQFFPTSDRKQLIAYINTPAGSSTLVTENAIQTLMNELDDRQKYPGVENITAYIGFGGPRFILSLTPVDPSPNAGFMLIDVASIDALDSTIAKLRAAAPSLLPNTDFRISGMFTGPSDPTVLQLQIKGPELHKTFAFSSELIDLFDSFPNMIHIWSNWFNLSTRMNISVNKAMAAQAGVTEQTILASIQQYLNGTNVTVVRQDDDVVPILLRGAEQEELAIDRLKSVNITTSGGETIPIEQLIEVEYNVGFPRIEKEDGVPTITIEGRNLVYSPEDLAPQMSSRIEEINNALPEGYIVEFDGIIADSAIGKAALAANFPLAICIITLILISQFSGFRRPLVVLLTIPLVVFGAGLGLRMMGGEFGFIVILGLLALAGIIVNNAIVLIDRADLERQSSSLSVREAIINAASIRMRPILITTITTIVGLLPLIIAKDVLFFSMASAIAFGLAMGTVLTLFVVPVLYELFTKNEKVTYVSNSTER